MKMDNSQVKTIGASYPCEQSCKVSLTPLKVFNANVGVFYLALALGAGIIAWFGSERTGPATFDSNIYRLKGHYLDNYVIPPPSAVSMVNTTPWGTALAILGALLVGAMFHFIYSLDFSRLYSLILVDRCNSMRWSQYAIVHTILGLIVGQVLGSGSFDFMMFCFLMLPVLGVLGYFSDKSYPCSPWMSYAASFGMLLIFLGYWIPVITNFAYRNTDAGQSAPLNFWFLLFTLLIPDFLVLIWPFVQSYGKISYFVTEAVQSILMLLSSALVLAFVGWTVGEQKKI